MRHQKKSKKFHRTEEERRRLWIDLCSALILSGKVETFTARGKWFRQKFDRLVTLVKRAGDDKNLAFRRLRPYMSEKVARKMIDDVAPLFANRQGGYTRQYKLSKDFDTQDRSIIMLVTE